MGEVFCIDCEYYETVHWDGSECNAPENVVIKKTWLTLVTEHFKHPKKINKHNDCAFYKVKEEEENND